MVWLTIPFLLQMVVISLDEYCFHLKRGLPLWERIGHPIDTLTVIACFLFCYFVPYSSTSLKWYILLALFSCIMVTKDEFVHKEHCPAKEQWLHAILFINHPILLASLGYIWKNPTLFLTLFTFVQLVLTSLFFSYQLIYWNLLCKKKI